LFVIAVDLGLVQRPAASAAILAARCSRAGSRTVASSAPISVWRRALMTAAQPCAARGSRKLAISLHDASNAICWSDAIRRQSSQGRASRATGTHVCLDQS